MKLLNCHIVNFGCLSDVSFRFDEGLNLLYAKNGQGKSTFAVFLKAMLYGLPPINKRALQESERKRYMPWQGGSFGGSLCFETEGEEYRLERFFGEKEKDDRFALYHLATGNLSDKYSENIGVELFGVDAEGFERSLYISQRLPFAAPDNNSIRARLGALLDASDDLGNFERADKLLDDARRYYSVQGGRGLIAELADAAREKDTEIATASAAGERAAALRAECAEDEAKKAEIAARLEETKAKRTQAEKRRLWEEQNATYRTLCEARDAEKLSLAPLEEFFAPHFPTDEEILAADSAVAEATTLAAQIDAATVTEEERATLASLSARYGVQASGGAFVEKLRSALTLWNKKKEVLTTLCARKEAREDATLSRLSARYPSDAEMLAIRTAKESVEQAQAALYRDSGGSFRTLPLVFLVLTALLTAVGVLGILLSVTALAVCGFALGALTTVLCLLSFARGKAQKSRLPDECRMLEERLLYLLSPFGYTDRNALLAASRFFDDLARFEGVRRELAALAEDIASARAEEAQARAVLFALLPDGTDDPNAAVQKIEADLSLYAHLLKKEAESAAQKKRLVAEHERASAKLSIFLSHFPSLASLSPRAALEQIKQNVALCRGKLLSYNRARGHVDEYLSTTHFDPEAPPPPYLGEVHIITEEERQTEAALREAQASLSVKINEAERLEQIAATLPALLAERKALDKDRENAEHTLSLILLAKSTLKEAKDDLATRYLRDMELHFDRYYQKMTEHADAELPADGSRISSFSMDTSLSLSVEKYGERRPVSVLSRGEADLVAFCARLSLMEAIFTAEVPFLLLDDPFINLDDENYAKACSLLASLAERFQIVYTVCSEARLPAQIPLKTLAGANA